MENRVLRAFLTVRAGVVAGVVGTIALSSPVWSAPESAGTDRGFVVTYFYYATNAAGSEDCPEGMALSSRDIYLANLPPDERAEMSKADKVGKLYDISIRTKEGKNICADPTAIPDRHMPTVHGGAAFGINLDGTDDGRATTNSCAHEKFSGLGDVPAVDNQLHRLMGCVSGFRPNAIDELYKLAAYRSGEYTVLIDVMGLKPGRNDGEVQVGIYSSSNPAPYAANGSPIANASLTIHKNPHFRAVTSGRIVDGVLTTDPVDLSLYHTVGRPSEISLKGARLRLQLLADGRAKGLLAGYQDVEFLYRHQVDLASPIISGANAAEMGFDCPSLYYAMKRLADGYPDPKTGQCTALSSVYKIEAVPAFVIQPPSDEVAAIQTAKANSGETGRVERWLRRLGL